MSKTQESEFGGNSLFFTEITDEKKSKKNENKIKKSLLPSVSFRSLMTTQDSKND